MKITVNQIAGAPRPSQEKIIKLARRVLKSIKIKNRSLEIDLVASQAIRRLNRRFCNIDRATDVLAFNLGEVGEIVISLDMARQRVRSGEAASFTEELNRYLIHGILHLAGFDDKKLNRRRRMLKKEEELVRKWGRG